MIASSHAVLCLCFRSHNVQLISLANACLVALLRLFKPSVAADNVILPNVADGEREERRNTRGCRKNGAHFERNMRSKLCFQSSLFAKVKNSWVKKKKTNPSNIAKNRGSSNKHSQFANCDRCSAYINSGDYYWLWLYLSWWLDKCRGVFRICPTAGMPYTHTPHTHIWYILVMAFKDNLLKLHIISSKQIEN